MSSIFLLSASYGNSTLPAASTKTLFGQAAEGGEAVVRAGYFGLCAKASISSEWACAAHGSDIDLILAGEANDPLNAVTILEHFKDDVIFPGLS